jgi:hypothetical protein
MHANQSDWVFCDQAEGILREALEKEREARRDAASRFVLNGTSRLVARLTNGADH